MYTEQPEVLLENLIHWSGTKLVFYVRRSF